jgi:hypothetical protein
MTRSYADMPSTPSTPPIVCLDFEASCLPTPLHESFPVEVGIAFVDGGKGRSWLIRPTTAWLETGFWDPGSERLHGLSLERLRREGRGVASVQRELAEAVQGHLVVIDNPSYDARWAAALYGGPAPFRIESCEAVLYDRAGLPVLAFRDALRDAAEAALVRVPLRHRAGADAQRLATTCRLMLRKDREA